LNARNGWLKVFLATSVCLLILYFYDLYDYIVMTNRRELLLRLVQALGIAWALLALLFYFVPPLMIGRGVSIISVPLVLCVLLSWRIGIHTLTGHPEIGEKILVVGTGQTALDTAQAVWERRDAGYRIAGFISENGAKPRETLGRSVILGKAPDIENVIRQEKIDRVVIAVRERRGAFPTEALLKMSLAGDVSIEGVGRNGKTFNVIKFRSMRTDAEADGTPVWAAADDERTTSVGRVIRKLRIDEIPQFWNIIKGEMNFVGPRPERPHFVSQLANEVSFYEHRHLVAPGLTGWAQVKYPYGASVADAAEKLQYDLYYIKNQSLTLDLMIIFDTVKTILFGRGR
jgi:lipopolysaccharide/colanic/teichoic acid biosynthesis glycosyltransferase